MSLLALFQTQINHSIVPESLEAKSEKYGLLPAVPNDFVEAFLRRRRRPNKGGDTDADYLLLDKRKSNRPVNSKKVRRKARLSSKERRLLRVNDLIKEEATSYDSYLPLQKLWLEYFRQVVNVDHAKLTIEPNHHYKDYLNTQLLKADYHGCIMTVTKSKCPCNVGKSGIVLQETRNVFKIITKENRLITIPKENNVFTFVANGVAFTLYGNQFRVKSSERAVRKFKTRATLSL